MIERSDGKVVRGCSYEKHTFAGILYLFGMILYPAGWGAERVQRICGPEADAFYLANCSLGIQIRVSRTFRLCVLRREKPFLSLLKSQIRDLERKENVSFRLGLLQRDDRCRSHLPLRRFQWTGGEVDRQRQDSGQDERRENSDMLGLILTNQPAEGSPELVVDQITTERSIVCARYSSVVSYCALLCVKEI